METFERQRHMLLTREIAEQLQTYGAEVSRPEPSRAFLEAFAGTLLKRTAELYALTRRPIEAPVVCGTIVRQGTAAPGWLSQHTEKCLAAAHTGNEAWNGAKD